MAFRDLKSNTGIISVLRQHILNGNVMQAYILEGPYTADKLSVATSFVQALLCDVAPGEGCGMCPNCISVSNGSHVDVIRVVKSTSKTSEKESIRDADIEEMISRLKGKPFAGNRMIAIVENADKMTLRAANRLLKTLEEPGIGSVIILLSENVYNLPDTILSRCVHLRVLSDENYSNEFSEDAKKAVEIMSQGRGYYILKNMIEKIGTGDDRANMFLDSLEEEYRNELINMSGNIKKKTIYDAIDKIENTRGIINRNGNVKYALKEMAIAIGGL